MPDLKLLSLGAGVQSTTLALMACRGDLDEFGQLDGAIFADTGWEPRGVYEHLARLEAELTRAGIPLYRVNNGNLRADTADPGARFASIPYFTLAPDGTTVQEDITERCPAGCEWIDAEPYPDPDTLRPCPVCNNSGVIVVGQRERPATRAEREGMGRRQCTHEYKLKPIGREVRRLLGATAPDYRRVPADRVAEQWIGFSTDEIHRVNDKRDTRYTVKRYPLLELNMSRRDCERWLRSVGWGSVAKSACIGCPFHGNRQWREMRDHRPEEWADAVEFDKAIRKGGARAGRIALAGEAFLHRSMLPLDIAPIERIGPSEWADRQIDIFDELAEQGDPDGCSPYGCRSGVADA